MKSNMIEKDSLSNLLKQPKSKQVLAFEEVDLEPLVEYANWAIAYLGNGLDEVLLPIVSHYGERMINYFELRDDLRRFSSFLGINLPKGVEALRLYCLGCVEDVARGDEEPRQMLQHLADLLRSYERVEDFDLIKELDDRFWSPLENETCEDVLASFRAASEKLASSLRTELHRQGECWRISIERYSRAS